LTHFNAPADRERATLVSLQRINAQKILVPRAPPRAEFGRAPLIASKDAQRCAGATRAARRGALR